MISRLLVLIAAQVASSWAQQVASADGQPPIEDAKLSEFTQDFLDFDLNKDDFIDAQEIRTQFKGDLDPKELHQFFLDVDKDNSGTVTLPEYIDYAISLG
jgi:Ca2+-binding EF-hand superfamily protein